MICFLGFNLANMHTKALSKQTIVDWDKSYYDGGTKEFLLHISNFGTLFVDLDETIAYDDYSVCIKDSFGIPVYSKQIDWIEDEDSSFDIELSEGDYTITFSTEGDVDFSVQAYFEYQPSIEHPVFEMNKKVLELYVGESAVLTIESEPEGVLFDVEWSSSNPSVAAVSENGTVMAKKVGSTVITAVVNGEVYECEVHVGKKSPTYKKIYSILKKNKGKNFSLDVIDVGKRCRLYATGIYSISDKHWYSQAFMSGCSYVPYIELIKKGDKVVTKYGFWGKFVQIDYFYSVDFDDLSLKLKTGNRRLSYKTNMTDSRSYYNYKKHFYVGKSTWNTTVSSSTSNAELKLNKFGKMLNQNSLSLKIVDVNGAFFELRIDKKHRNYWKKLLNIYRKILEEY